MCLYSCSGDWEGERRRFSAGREVAGLLVGDEEGVALLV
jgi:hypothetical protein